METQVNSPFEDYFEQIRDSIKKKVHAYDETVLNSQEYKQGLKHLHGVIGDFVNTLRSIAFYSTRGGEIYPEFLTIRTIDELIQSAMTIGILAENGVFGTVKRELRYLIELTTKNVIIDYRLMGKSLESKIDYLHSEIANSSIEDIETFTPPFDAKINAEFIAEMKDFFRKACAYVHPSRKQFEERIASYEKGYTIGFEPAKMLTDANQLIFRAFDMILVLVFHGFGESMSGDLFINFLDDRTNWKFHKGKYISRYSRLFDYKAERKDRKATTSGGR